ncbi:alpha/beta hydrolase, partial [Lactococcus taiwanensis]|uniref:alpha/beta hydrolase n=1 Tax=Lactococcus taiwanensis TaxID=1151742 RepID=UPI00351476F7
MKDNRFVNHIKIFLLLLSIFSAFLLGAKVKANIFTDAGADIAWPLFFKTNSGEDREKEQQEEKRKWEGLFLNNQKSEKYVNVRSGTGVFRLHAFYVNNNSSTTVILQHGYNANSLSLINEAQIFSNQGYNILLPDARGVGLSGGNFTSFGAVERDDIREWIKLAKQDSSRIILFGQSMGASTVLLSQESGCNVDAIIEDCGYTDLRQELKDAVDSVEEIKKIATKIPFLHWDGFKNGIVDSINKKYFIPTFSVDIDSIKPVNAVRNLNIPKLFIHGTSDTLVPTINEQIFYSNSCTPKKEYLVNGAKHADNYRKNPAEYIHQLTDFEIENGLFHPCIDGKLNIAQSINNELNLQNIDCFNNRRLDSEIYEEEVRQLNNLNLSNTGISNLQGLENASNLNTLDLSHN